MICYKECNKKWTGYVTCPFVEYIYTYIYIYIYIHTHTHICLVWNLKPNFWPKIIINLYIWLFCKIEIQT